MEPKKSKVIKNSKRGITFSDSEMFPIGTKYKYVIDGQNRKIVILNSGEEGPNTVSRKKRKDGYIPLIDIRNKEALASLAPYDYLQVTIEGDEITVEGYKEASSVRVKKKAKNVVDIKDFLRVRKSFEVSFSKKTLEKVVGEQLSFDSFDWSLAEGVESSRISKAVKDLHIPLQIASLFSGGGIFDTGFVEAGFEILFALEKNEEAAMTYRHNLGDHIVVADVTTYNKGWIPKAPVMIGGPPCQGFSNSNRHSNFLDNPNNLLMKEYIDAIRSNENCQVFVIENVPGLLTAGGGRFKHEIYNTLSDFEITSGVVSAASYGTPQDRERAIFIGSKIGKIDLPEPTHQKETYTTVGEAFQGLHSGIENQKDYTASKASTVERMKHIGQGENWRVLPEHLKTDAMREEKAHSCIYRRLSLDHPSVTVVNPRKTVLTHPTENRIISVREAARLFDLKDDFVFKGSLASMQQMVANSVPVKLAKAIGTVIKNAIIQYNLRNGTGKLELV